MTALKNFRQIPTIWASNHGTGQIEDGKLIFKDHEQTGDHWPTGDTEEGVAKDKALKAPEDRISDAAMTRDNAESLGDVMKTKTGHLDEIAHNKGPWVNRICVIWRVN